MSNAPEQLPAHLRPITVEIPVTWTPEQALAAALANPIGTPPLVELARGKKSACVVICDITRPVPNRLLLRPMVETMVASGIALDRNHSVRALGEQCARKPARPRADLDHIDARERTSRTCDPVDEIEIKKEILSERFFGAEIVSTDDLPQGRKIVNGAHAGLATRGSVLAVSRDASCSAAIKLPGRARPVPAISSAVP